MIVKLEKQVVESLEKGLGEGGHERLGGDTTEVVWRDWAMDWGHQEQQKLRERDPGSPVDMKRQRKRKDLGIRLVDKDTDELGDIEMMSEMDDGQLELEDQDAMVCTPIRIIEVPDNICQSYSITEEDEIELFEEIENGNSFQTNRLGYMTYFLEIREKYSVVGRFLDWIQEKERIRSSCLIKNKPVSPASSVGCSSKNSRDSNGSKNCQECQSHRNYECNYASNRENIPEMCNQICRDGFDKGNGRSGAKSRTGKYCNSTNSADVIKRKRKTQLLKNSVMLQPLKNEANTAEIQVLHLKKL